MKLKWVGKNKAAALVLVSFQVSEKVAAALTKASKDSGKSRSQIMRELLCGYLNIDCPITLKTSKNACYENEDELIDLIRTSWKARGIDPRKHPIRRLVQLIPPNLKSRTNNDFDLLAYWRKKGKL